MKTYVINPDTQKPVSIEEWAKDADPTRAQLLLVDTGEKRILVRKAFLPEGEVDFNRAQELCAAYRPFPESPFTFRAPTRKECIDLYTVTRANGSGPASGTRTPPTRRAPGTPAASAAAWSAATCTARTSPSPSRF